MLRTDSNGPTGATMLRITRDLLIDENDIEIGFVRASGPGGQNVNKCQPRRSYALTRAASGCPPMPRRASSAWPASA